MKRFLCVFFIGVLLLCGCGCAAKTPKAVVERGYPYTWSDGNVMTVTGVEVKDGAVEVEVELDFSTANISDLEQAVIRNTDGEHIAICCSRVFAQEDGGEQRVFLVFKGKDVDEGFDLSQYVLSVPVGYDTNGNVSLKDAMALG